MKPRKCLGIPGAKCIRATGTFTRCEECRSIYNHYYRENGKQHAKLKLNLKLNYKKGQPKCTK